MNIKNNFVKLVRWWRRLDQRCAFEEDRQIRAKERKEAEYRSSIQPCPFCGASMKKYQVTNRSHKGKVACASKEWTCGTKTSLNMMFSDGFERGEQCLYENVRG